MKGRDLVACATVVLLSSYHNDGLTVKQRAVLSS
jgi:hypothetical protein